MTTRYATLPHGQSLQRFLAEAEEIRAGRAAIVALLDHGTHRVDNIRRPERDDAARRDRKPDFLVELDGQPVAIEVTWLGDQNEVEANRLLTFVRSAAKARAEELLPSAPRGRQYIVDLSYQILVLLGASRAALLEAGAQIAEAAITATADAEPGERRRFEVPVDWASDVQAVWLARTESRRSARLGIHDGVGGPRHQGGGKDTTHHRAQGRPARGLFRPRHPDPAAFLGCRPGGCKPLVADRCPDALGACLSVRARSGPG